MGVVNGFKNGNRILKYNYNALENIPNELLIVTSTAPYSNFDTPATDALAAIKQHKTVIVRLVSADYSTLVWDLYLVEERIISYSGIRQYVFAAPANGGNYMAPCAVQLNENDGDDATWNILQIACPSLTTAASFEIGNYGSMHQHTLIFSDDAGGYWSPNSIENILPFGDQLDQIVSAAWTAAETQKTSLSVVFADDIFAPTLYDTLASNYSGTVGLMIHGRGSVISFSVGSDWFSARCIGVYKAVSTDNYFATFAGRLKPQISKSDGTINAISNYPYTIDIYAEKIENQDGTYSYQATVTITVEKIPSTIVPMT